METQLLLPPAVVRVLDNGDEPVPLLWATVNKAILPSRLAPLTPHPPIFEEYHDHARFRRPGVGRHGKGRVMRLHVTTPSPMPVQPAKQEASMSLGGSHAAATTITGLDPNKLEEIRESGLVFLENHLRKTAESAPLAPPPPQVSRPAQETAVRPPPVDLGASLLGAVWRTRPVRREPSALSAANVYAAPVIPGLLPKRRRQRKQNGGSLPPLEVLRRQPLNTANADPFPPVPQEMEHPASPELAPLDRQISEQCVPQAELEEQLPRALDEVSKEQLPQALDEVSKEPPVRHISRVVVRSVLERACKEPPVRHVSRAVVRSVLERACKEPPVRNVSRVVVRSVLESACKAESLRRSEVVRQPQPPSSPPPESRPPRRRPASFASSVSVVTVEEAATPSSEGRCLMLDTTGEEVLREIFERAAVSPENDVLPCSRPPSSASTVAASVFTVQEAADFDQDRIMALDATGDEVLHGVFARVAASTENDDPPPRQRPASSASAASLVTVEEEDNEALMAAGDEVMREIFEHCAAATEPHELSPLAVDELASDAVSQAGKSVQALIAAPDAVSQAFAISVRSFEDSLDMETDGPLAEVVDIDDP
eukprot:TRINITY_DN14933_c0_g1_i1.p1 TRINITY_DN14933_c0_g1~~TRINITY_DN14933_c0_g1_i1.p1  ORF type:complete len:599 (+),score=115.83 TRINITY_DN14933_c0_g1_i1:90-1886(+)